MRLYEYALFRVVARSGRNPVGTGVGRSHGFTGTVNVGLVSGSRTGSLGPEVPGTSS